MLKRTRTLILHRTPYSDSSLIVKGFCYDFGVQSFLVKSAKKENSPFRGALDPLAESELVFNDSGKSDLHFVREATLVEWFPELRKDLELSAMANVMAEILLRYMPAGMPQEMEFRYTEKALKLLERGPNKKDVLVRWMWHIADLSGYALSLDECVRCGKKIQDANGDFLFESGGAVCKDCRGQGEREHEFPFIEDIARLRSTGPLKDPQSLEREFFKFIRTHLGEGREIKAYKWLEEVRTYAFGSSNP